MSETSGTEWSDIHPVRCFGFDHPDLVRVDTPVGEKCGRCDELIQLGDKGQIIPHLGKVVKSVPHHRECFLRSIVGSVGHIEKTCSCYGGDDCGDPPDMTVREAAQAALVAYERKENVSTD